MSRSSSLLDVRLEPALDLGRDRALGMVGEELPGSLDQVGERTLGSDSERTRSSTNCRSSGGLPGGQLVS